MQNLLRMDRRQWSHFLKRKIDFTPPADTYLKVYVVTDVLVDEGMQKINALGPPKRDRTVIS
jgi:hypothetical protein